MHKYRFQIEFDEREGFLIDELTTPLGFTGRFEAATVGTLNTTR